MKHYILQILVATIAVFCGEITETAETSENKQGAAMSIYDSLAKRKPVLIHDAFFRIRTLEFMPMDDWYNKRLLAPRGLHPDIIVVPMKPDSGGIGSACWTGFEFSLEYEKIHCDFCGEDKEDYSRPTKVRGYEIYDYDHEKKNVTDFIPAWDILVVSKEMKGRLEKSPFRGFELLEIPDVDNHIFDPKEWKNVPELFLVVFKGTAKNKEYEKWLREEHDPIVCQKCGQERQCRKCGSYFSPCPKCGSDSFGTSPPAPKEVRDACYATFPYYGTEIFEFSNEQIKAGTQTVHTLSGEEWDGSDFIDDYYVSGRVAKWLVEHQYGPALLIPFPMDISRCNKEQLEAIEKIRYKRGVPAK